MERETTAAGGRIWLIAPDWEVRALARAQLREEGYAVLAVEDWESLKALLAEDEVMAPGLLIVELTGDEPPEAMALLRAFPARRLVLRQAGAPDTAGLRAAGIDAVLSRPYSIGDITRAARRLLSGTRWSSTKDTNGHGLQGRG